MFYKFHFKDAPLSYGRCLSSEGNIAVVYGDIEATEFRIMHLLSSFFMFTEHYIHLALFSFSETANVLTPGAFKYRQNNSSWKQPQVRSDTRMAWDF